MGIGNFFQGVKRALGAVVGAVVSTPQADAVARTVTLTERTFQPSVRLLGIAAPRAVSRRDLQLSGEAFLVKRKLGPSYFTRGLTAGTRAARVASLKPHELAIARVHGWVR